MKSAAPGLKKKRNADGSIRYYWAARADLVRAGYRPTLVRLHFDPDLDGEAAMAARCRVLQAEMLAWAAAGKAFPARGYDGTVAGLCRLFQTEAVSPLHKVKWNSRRLYLQYLAIIEKTVGARVLRELRGPDFLRWHENWSAPEKEGKAPRPFRGRHAVDVLRRVVSFGVMMGFEDCARVDLILGKLRFEAPPARRQRMTREHVEVIRKTAHAMGLGSVALATALQFDCAFRQKDVIGEWLPAPDGEGGIRWRDLRWANGLTFADIDSSGILRKTHVKTGVAVEHDMSLCAMASEELALIPAGRRIGPLIISEATGEPYKHRTYTQTFRRVADAAGIPAEVWSMDARSGAITEAYAAGADEVSVMKAAGHLNRQTSARYNRESLEQTRRVARLRAAKQTENK